MSEAPHASRRLHLVASGDYDRVEVDQLREFARKVEDEGHWQRLLASAESDAAREELERVVGPLLPFRQARCHTPSCESGLDPIWQPVLLVRKRPEDGPIFAPIEIRICKDCKAEMTVKDVLTGGIWSQILAACLAAGEPIPRREYTQLLFDRVQ